MTAYQETGNRLPIISLGGIQSNRGWGRNIEISATPVLGLYAGIQQIMPDNPRRISAIILNNTPGVVFLSAPGNDWYLLLQPGGSLQIDNNFPYTGPILAFGDALAANNILNIAEISV